MYQARVKETLSPKQGPPVIVLPCVEAETRLGDVQATERRLRAKQRDLGATRAILLVADTRHNRRVITVVPDLTRQFPVGTRGCLAAFRAGRDPGADCLVIL